MKKRILMIVMVILLIFSTVLTLVSCSNGENPDDDIVVTRPTPDAHDFEGYTVKFAVCEGYNNESLVKRSICPDENSGDPVDKAVIARNKAIENRYNCNIEMTYYIANENISLTPEILSGSGDYDVIVGRQCDDISLCLNNYLVDVANHEDTAPYIDLESKFFYWGTDYIKGLSYNGKVYWLTGEISLNYTVGFYCTFVNAALYEENFSKSEGSIYDIVRNKEWTVDKVKMLADAVTTEKNITFDELIVSEEYIGIAMPVNETVNALALASGVKFCETDRCTLNRNNTALHGFFDKYYELIDSGNMINTGDDYDSAFMAIKRDNALMTFGYLHQAVTYLKDQMTSPYYILPMPMLSAEQGNYVSPLINDLALFGISSSSKNIKATAIVLEAMCKESYRSVRPYYYEEDLGLHYTTDLDSAEMMDIICKSAYTDTVYAWSGTEYFEGVGNMIKNAFADCKDAEAAIKTFPVAQKIWDDDLSEIISKLSGANN
ncbi:MAG: hypothetical protein E7633_08105 [Ruminococcaceae bacterium]|nr:hypothetical protein [Oscillospiraceae bacterium]